MNACEFITLFITACCIYYILYSSVQRISRTNKTADKLLTSCYDCGKTSTVSRIIGDEHNLHHCGGMNCMIR